MDIETASVGDATASLYAPVHELQVRPVFVHDNGFSADITHFGYPSPRDLTSPQLHTKLLLIKCKRILCSAE